MIRIAKWEQFQHYRDRNPPWLKLHRSLINQREWHELSADAAKLLVELWIIAADSTARDGTIHENLENLAWRVRRPVDLVARCLRELSPKFLEVVDDAASALADNPPPAPPTPPAPEPEPSRPPLVLVQGGTDATADDADTASEDEPAPTDDAKAEEARWRGEAAALIREHLWLGKSPPQAVVDAMKREGKRWTMANELTIWRDFARADGYEAATGAIKYIRDAFGAEPDRPLSLLYVNKRDNRGWWRVAVGTWQKREATPAASTGWLGDVLKGARHG